MEHDGVGAGVATWLPRELVSVDFFLDNPSPKPKPNANASGSIAIAILIAVIMRFFFFSSIPSIGAFIFACISSPLLFGGM